MRTKIKNPFLKSFNKHGLRYIREFYTVDSGNIEYDRTCFLCKYKFNLKDKVFLTFENNRKYQLICETCSKK